MTSTSHAPGALLTEAFDGFRRAAATLERRHAALQVEVEQLKHRLRDADRRLGTVLDALETGVAVLTREGAVHRANRAFDAMGLDPVEDDGLRDWIGGNASRAGTRRFNRRVGDSERELVVTLVPVGDGADTQVLTAHDVTEIRREEEEGGRRRRLEAMGRMAAELAHELRNPLGGIQLFASMLCDDLPEHRPQREMAEQILEATASLEATLSNLLSFAAPSRATRTAVDLTELGTGVCALLAPACALRGVRLDGPTGPPCRVHADPEAVRRIVLNLLGNALAATPDDGRISVRVTTDADLRVLVVEDSGCGIAPDDLPRVFDPFFTRTRGGTGLGLSVVQRIVESHGGRISLDSSPGRGTRARVELPAPPPEEVR